MGSNASMAAIAEEPSIPDASGIRSSIDDLMALELEDSFCL